MSILELSGYPQAKQWLPEWFGRLEAEERREEGSELKRAEEKVWRWRVDKSLSNTRLVQDRNYYRNKSCRVGDPAGCRVFGVGLMDISGTA
ncbi:hypothetical protein J6590_039436 [Homalodisca vitripennis]|nr:hypothetical protein J6590_039436 [Homalodisca vitripennis]